MGHLSWAPAFQSRRHEHSFQQEQEAMYRRLDQRAGVLAVVLFGAACIRFSQTNPMRMALGLALVSLCLAPLVWCTLLRAPASYSRRRLWVITGGLRGVQCCE